MLEMLPIQFKKYRTLCFSKRWRSGYIKQLYQVFWTGVKRSVLLCGSNVYFKSWEQIPGTVQNVTSRGISWLIQATLEATMSGACDSPGKGCVQGRMGRLTWRRRINKRFEEGRWTKLAQDCVSWRASVLVVLNAIRELVWRGSSIHFHKNVSLEHGHFHFQVWLFKQSRSSHCRM